jgi:hypothetical protein
MNQPSDDSINRQIEINEWAYQNKMDTVFTLQVTFIAVAIVGILFYFKRAGVVGTAFSYYTSGIVLILVTLIIINRLFFTSARRDPRMWHRFRFGEDNKKVPDTINDVGVNDLLATIRGLQQKGTDCTKCGTAPTVSNMVPSPPLI